MEYEDSPSWGVGIWGRWATHNYLQPDSQAAKARLGRTGRNGYYYRKSESVYVVVITENRFVAHEQTGTHVTARDWTPNWEFWTPNWELDTY